ncbi:MAG: transglutaminase-like domain-containing protein [Propionibacteriaceae bacterium]|jgi:hypothetical protein|nr:transglutaminase-like domain-containing protein [Propionibacteriaceae bacterium]
MRNLLRLVPVALLLALPVAAFEPIFGSGIGLRAAGTGAVVGLLLAWFAVRFRWDALTSFAILSTVYLAGAGPAALPQTMDGYLPTWTSVQLAVTSAVDSWKDVLTLSPPLGAYTGPAVLPWLGALVLSFLCGILALKRHFVASGVCLGALGAIAIAWGSASANSMPTPLGYLPRSILGAAWAIGILAWWAWNATRNRVDAGEEIVVGRQAVEEAVSGELKAKGVSVVRPVRRALVAALTLGAALAGGMWVAPLSSGERHVLRELVEPPFDIQDYASPLASFRHYTTDLADEELARVDGELPKNTRLRIAALDSYNGIVFSITSKQASEGGFTRVGDVIAGVRPAGQDAQLAVTTSNLAGPWIPNIGQPYSVRFEQQDRQEGLYSNETLNTLLTTAGMRGTASYSLETVIAEQPAPGTLESLDAAASDNTPDSNVPQQIPVLAREITAGKSGAYAKVKAVEEYLSGNGFFSNTGGSEAQPGHRADRIERMFSGDQIVGDDEQYAAAMTLMLHSLGIRARVVMGLYADESAYPGSGVTTFYGRDVHVWVEAAFDSVGWVSFDPTPPRDKNPQTDTNRPHTVPNPQVLPPPDPAKDPVELPPEVVDRPDNADPPESAEIPWEIIGYTVAGVGAVALPLLLISSAKALRRRGRKRAPTEAARARGAWDELVDSAVDSGQDLPTNLTRMETARLLDLEPETPPEANAAQLAVLVDAMCFAEHPLVSANQAWEQARTIRKLRGKALGWFGRTRRAFSLRSFRQRKSAASRPPKTSRRSRSRK